MQHQPKAVPWTASPAKLAAISEAAEEKRATPSQAKPAADCGKVRGSTPSASDVEGLLQRCLTHERPQALLSASNDLLDAALLHLGHPASSCADHTRSDKLRKLLQLTNAMRAEQACDVESGCKALARRSSASRNPPTVLSLAAFAGVTASIIFLLAAASRELLQPSAESSPFPSILVGLHRR
mmetsp:Transcript_27383/g.63913  ORF Transcript_27383/g.63913 Transcript_27383/m.63913 type:complete len:183 (-) Transcript_27383:77-625(-)